MDASRRVSGYDLFKFSVAIILLILILLLLKRPAAQSSERVPAESSPTEASSFPASPTRGANPVVVRATATSLAASPTSIALPSPSVTVEVTPTASAPPPTDTSLPTLTPTAEPTSATTACDSARSRSRLQTGMNATILRRLNFRSSPGIRNNWLLTNRPGTRVEVVGGPECLPHHAGAYVWWQIRLPDGEIGWSAEGSIHGTFYFMEPAK